MRYSVRILGKTGLVDLGYSSNTMMVEADYIEISDKNIIFYEDGAVDIMDQSKKIIAIFPVESTIIKRST